jgi:hypothetical protein
VPHLDSSHAQRVAIATSAGQARAVSRWLPALLIGCSGWLSASPLVDTSAPVSATAASIKATDGDMFEVIYSDPPGIGFNDASVVEAVPGNPATTLGEQRRTVMEAALDLWATRLDSNAPIRVQVVFDPFMGCDFAAVAIVGGADIDFANAPRPDIFYPSAMVRALTGEADPFGSFEIGILVNPNLETGCAEWAPEGFWNGLGSDVVIPEGAVSLYALLSHELVHGLGFVSELPVGLVDDFSNQIFKQFVYSTSLQKHWPELSPEEQQMVFELEGDLVWDGPQVTARAQQWLISPGRIEIEPPIDGVAEFPAFVNGFPDEQSISGALVVAENPVDELPSAGGLPRVATDGCEPLSNDVAGKMVLVTRGACTFARKWQHVYDAGGIAAIVADNLPADDPFAHSQNGRMGLGRRLPIPLYGITLELAQRLQEQLPERVTLGVDASQSPAGVVEGKVALDFARSHFSGGQFPHPLMSYIVPSQHFTLPDLSTDLLLDLGWPSADGKKPQFTGSWFKPSRSGEGCVLSVEADQQTFIVSCYLYLDGAQAWLYGDAQLDGDYLTVDNVVITRGAQYGAAFDPADVERIPWGRIQMQIYDCNNARFGFYPSVEPYTEFAVAMTRIVPANCQLPANRQPDRALSGNYFDPDRSGEGVQIVQESDGQTFVIAYYSYLDGEQMWAFGSGQREGDRIVFGDTVITRGADYGADFDPDAVERIPFGTITADILDCNRIHLAIEPVLEAFEPSERELTRIVSQTCTD